MPPVVTLGPVLEKSSNLLSWSIEDDVLIKQWLPIIVPVLITEFETITEPSPMVTLPLIIEFLEITVAHLKFFIRVLTSSKIFFLMKLYKLTIRYTVHNTK